MVGRLNSAGPLAGEGPGVRAAAFPPIVTMLSYSIVFRHGLERYVADA